MRQKIYTLFYSCILLLYYTIFISKYYKSKNNLSTFHTENGGIFENSQLQTDYTGFSKKECNLGNKRNAHFSQKTLSMSP